MIQRIQSVYLFLTTLFSVLFVSGKMIRLTDEAGDLLYVTAAGLKKISPAGEVEHLEKVLPLILILIIIASLALITIFLFQNRKLQIKLSATLIILSMLLIFGIAYYIYTLSSGYKAAINLNLNLILPVFILITSVLAYRGIRKDEEMVKSYDRLR